MTTNEFITTNYKELRRSAYNITKNDCLTDDLISDAVLIFLEKPNAQAIVDTGAAFFYMIRILLNQYKSQTSPFHKTYRKTVALEDDYDRPIDEPEDPELAKSLMNELGSLHWYQQTLFKLNALDGHSVSKISRDTQIPRSSITMEIKRVKEHLKQHAKKHNN